MKATQLLAQQGPTSHLDKQKLVIAARIRVHNTINYKEDEQEGGKSENQTKNQLKDNVSQAGTLKSKSILQSSQISSNSSITNRTGKTGVSQAKLGAQKQKKKKDESKVSIYACKMSEKNPLTNIVSLNQVPISYSLLSKYLKNDKNIIDQKQTLLPKSRQYSLDVAFSQETSQDELYSFLLKKRIKQTLNGFQTSVFLIGPEYSGRKYTVRGDENIMNKSAHVERGLMVRACEDILSLIDISKESIRSRKAIVGGVYYNLGVQIYCVKDDAEVDLLVNAPEQLLNKNENQDVEMGCFDITSTNDLLVYYRQAQNRLNMINDTLKGQDFKRNSTIFIRLLVLKQLFKLFSNKHTKIIFLKRNKQIYSSVNFALFFDYDLLNQQKFYPIRDYLREVERMQKRQLKTYQFNNKLLHHLNLCFSSGPEYSAVLLGQFDSTPQQLEHSQHLLSVLSNLRTSNSQKTRGAPGQMNLKLNTVQSNENDTQETYQEQDKEVLAFIQNSNRKSQKSELDETAGFNAISNQQDQLLEDLSPKSFKYNGRDGVQEGFNEVKESQLSQAQNALEQGDSIEATKQYNERKLNTFGNENTYKNGVQYGGQYDESQYHEDNSYENSQYHQFNQSQRVPQNVESVVRDIFSYSDATKGMDEKQCLQWVLQQERNLEYFQDNVNLLKPPVRGSSEDLKLRKIIEARKFIQDLKGELDLKEYVQKNLQDSPNDRDDSYDDALSQSSGIDTRAYLNRDRQYNRVISLNYKIEYPENYQLINYSI